MPSPVVSHVLLSHESGVQVTECHPAIVIWLPPGDDDTIVAVHADGTITPNPSGTVIQPADSADDPFAPRA